MAQTPVDNTQPSLALTQAFVTVGVFPPRDDPAAARFSAKFSPTLSILILLLLGEREAPTGTRSRSIRIKPSSASSAPLMAAMG
jgi:hypothetical protein